MRKFTRRDWYLVGGLTLIAALLRFIRLHYPGEIIFDETYFANFAHDYLTHTKFFDAEPPLGKFLIAGGEGLFGFNSFGWRVAPALLGTAVIPLIYVFVKRLFGGVVVPAIAAVLALLDGLLLVESRTAVLDIFVVFFNLLTYTLFLFSLQAPSRRRSVAWLVATGVSFGLALSLKWITLAFIAPAVMILVLLAWSGRRWVRRLFRLRGREALFKSLGAARRNLHHPLLYLVTLGLLPVALYIFIFSLHVPFDSTGGSIWEIHRQIYNYHHSLKATHPYGSHWYSWPFLYRPVAYYFNTQNSQWAGVVALGNPVIWWSGVVALVYAAVRFLQTRSLPLLIVLAAFAAHFLPWSVISRVLFIYHYLGAFPFVLIALAFLLGDLWKWRPRDASPLIVGWTLLLLAGGIIGGLIGRSWFGQLDALVGFAGGAVAVMAAISAFLILNVRSWSWGRKQVITFLFVTVLAFVFFYPIWTGVPLDPSDYYRHMWLRSWI